MGGAENIGSQKPDSQEIFDQKHLFFKKKFDKSGKINKKCERHTKANCAKAVTHSNTNSPCMFWESNPAEPFCTVFYKPAL